MAPKIESDVLGRHGQVGVDVLSHDLPLEVGLPVDASYAEMVDEMDRRVAEKLRLERVVQERSGEIAMADTVSVAASQETPHEAETYGLYL